MDDFAKSTVVVYYNADYARDPKGTNYVRNRILKVAKKLADENIDVRFAISNAKDFREDLTQYGITEATKDVKYVLARGTKDEKYQMPGDFRYELPFTARSMSIFSMQLRSTGRLRP